VKIAILSDIHGNMAHLASAKKIINETKIDTIICCGDIQDEEAFLEMDSWPQTVLLALGNADYAIRENLDSGALIASHIKVFIDYGVLNAEKRKIAFCHYPKYADKLAESGKFDVVFYGHDHRPWERKIGKTVLLNPGEIQARDGQPTFAIYDLTAMKGELKILV